MVSVSVEDERFDPRSKLINCYLMYYGEKVCQQRGKTKGTFNIYGYILANIKEGVTAMVFNTTFNNISVILWLSVLLMEETGVPG